MVRDSQFLPTVECPDSRPGTNICPYPLLHLPQPIMRCQGSRADGPPRIQNRGHSMRAPERQKLPLEGQAWVQDGSRYCPHH